MSEYKKVLSQVGGEVIDQGDDRTGISPSETIADAGIYDTGIDAFTGTATISIGTDSTVAVCTVAASVQVISSIEGSSKFSATKATATKVNVYVEDGTIQIQNLTGADISVSARLF